ncbi:MAG: hypothetical protein J1E41_07655, partial [Ruminococcus sp.]|nr:hypothetical protein [Ruminococcus sp.]
CGAPLNYNTQPSVAEPVAQEVPQTVAQTPVEQIPVQPQQQQPQSQPAVPNKPKKPLSKKAKLTIILSSATALVIIIAAFIINTVIIPNSKLIDVSNYIRMDFGTGDLYNEHFSGKISIDADKIYNKYLDNDEYVDRYNYIYDAEQIKDDFLKYCDVTAYVKESDNNNNIEKDLNLSNIKNYQSLNQLSTDDVIVVIIRWVKSEDDLIKLDSAEKSSGIKFDKTDKTIELKVSDELKKDALSVKEPINFDFFKYVNDNNLVITNGITDGWLNASLKPTSFEKDNCKFNLKVEGDYYSSETNLYVEDMYGNKGNLYIFCPDLFDSDEGYYEGEKAKFSIDAHYDEGEAVQVPGTAVFIENPSTEYIVKANEPITVKQAKDNLDKIKDAIKESAKNDDCDISTIKDVYLLTSEDTDETEDTNKIFAVVKENNDSSYFGYWLRDVYLSDGEIKIRSSNSSDTYSWFTKSAKDVVKDSSILNNSNYRKTKIS